MPDDWGTPTVDDFTFDGSTYSQEDLGGNTDNVNKEGWYHLEVTDVVPELDTLNKGGKERTPSVRFDLTVLESVDGQSPAGSRHFHRIYVGGKGGASVAEGSVKSALRFGLGLGVLTEIEKDGKKVIVDSDTRHTRIGVGTFQRAKGSQLVAFIKKGEDDPKYGPKYEIPFSRVYQVDDPQVADTPKNVAAMAMVGKKSAAKAEMQPSDSAAGHAAASQAVAVPDDF